MQELKPPGPGVWEIDATHFPRPVTRFHAELVGPAMSPPFREALSRYGALLGDLEYQPVNGFLYSCPRPVGAPRGAKGPPPKLVLKLLMALHPELRRRRKISRKNFETRPWRADVALWENEVKPAAIRSHLALQAIDPDMLEGAALVEHLTSCREHVRKMISQHHQFSVSCLVPVGDLMAQTADWTGLPPSAVLSLLRGSSPVSAGASAELDRLGRALKERKYPAGPTAAARLAALREDAGELGAAARAWLDLVGYRVVDGFDIGQPYALEMPELLEIAARGAAGGTVSREASAEEIARVRDRVPSEHRAAFDALLEEARPTYKLRDERGLFSELWASGIARRAVLSAGRRLVEAGRLQKAEHLAEADWEEMRALASGGPGPTGDDLAARAAWRKSTSYRDMPAALGGTPSGPPPLDWLPIEVRRTERAVRTVLQALFGEATSRCEARLARGLAVSSGIHEGTARVVTGPDDFGRLQKGDVLITRSTSAAFNVVLPMLGSIVTDRGGALSHAAIVAREYGIPAVVGCKDATQVIPDGARVCVNGDLGEARVI